MGGELCRDRSLIWNLGVLFCLHSGLLLSTPFGKNSFDYIMPGLCCLFGLSFGNVAGHPSKCEQKVCTRAQHEEQVVMWTSLPGVQIQGRVCPAWDDLNCLFWGMWPEECLGLPLGLADFTQGYLPPAPPPAAAHPHVCESAATKMKCKRISAWDNF